MGENGHLPPKSNIKRWLVTTNHKDIGVLYLVTSMFFLVMAGILALLIRAQMWAPGATVLDPSGYYQVATSHGFLMVFWFLSPFAFGFANYVVPLQIGADDLAFPRLNAMSYWLYLFSGVLFGISFFQGATFMGGWTMYAPLNAPAFIPNYGHVGSFAAILALVMFTGSVTIGSVNFLTTIYRMRAEGLRMRDIPLFSMSILLTVWMMLFAFAALLGALVILSSDHLLHTSYFADIDGNPSSGGSLLWTHLFWFFGHPEVYIVFFPALGAMAEIVQTFSGRRLVGRKWFVIAMALVAIQSFIVWMHHMFLTTINLPIKTIMMVTTIGISLPFDLMVFGLIYTMIKGRVRWKTPFLFVLGALLIFIVGGITGVFLGAIVLDYSFRGTYWVVAHFHYVMASGAVALIGALYYWYPKITGKMYNEFLGKIHFVVAFVGFNLLYFPMFVVWETPRRMFEYSAGFTFWHRVASVGAALFAASFVIMIYNLFVSLYSDRVVDDSPWAYTGSTEWAVPSPPPTENFPGIPSFKSGSLRFLDAPEATDGGVEGDEATPDGGQVTAATDHRCSSGRSCSRCRRSSTLSARSAPGATGSLCFTARSSRRRSSSWRCSSRCSTSRRGSSPGSRARPRTSGSRSPAPCWACTRSSTWASSRSTCPSRRVRPSGRSARSRTRSSGCGRSSDRTSSCSARSSARTCSRASSSAGRTGGTSPTRSAGSNTTRSGRAC
ncbi:MAG: hypothetical protein BRD21_09775 [Halobacteriales archaeon SW_8_66_22]|nr:MAG: hypothetical protein BRD21_09775 [Halobacteriales archaeon SW_8_66_22]